MPHQPVVVNRWRVVVAFLLVMAVGVAVAGWNDHRISVSANRIERNQGRVALLTVEQALARERSRQAAVRVADAQRAAEVACSQVAALKGEIVAVLVSQRQSALRAARLLPGYPPKLLQDAAARLNHAIKLFRPTPCTPRSIRHHRPSVR